MSPAKLIPMHKAGDYSPTGYTSYSLDNNNIVLIIKLAESWRKKLRKEDDTSNREFCFEYVL